MAIWQLQCNIIPKRNDISVLSREELISWKGIPQPEYEIIFLEKEKSWSEDIIQYGKADETCIQFLLIGNMLEEINCRFDLRNLTKMQLSLIVEYAQKIDAMFFCGRHKLCTDSRGLAMGYKRIKSISIL